jgi:hypothetical protein
MVARISTGKSISKILNYNEQKVGEGTAELLTASGFLKAPERLNFYDKVGQFERHTSLNKMAVTNALHVSLNFDPSEKLSNELMAEIAAEYMERIGFGYQPYLVYRHEDAGHPHLHIVTTNIQGDGNRIPTHNLGRNQSEKARKELEEEYGLVKAEGRRLDEAKEIMEMAASKVVYGRSPTKRAITNVLWPVVSKYKYTSLTELNAVLGMYNVVADKGGEGSRLSQYRGLIYRVLDDKGARIGTPVKASGIWFKPTLPYLEKRFADNKLARMPHRQRLMTAIDWAMHGKKLSLAELATALGKEQVVLVVRQNKDGVVYGLTYIDQKTKCVFNGSDLGKAYSANAVIDRLRQDAAVETIIKKPLASDVDALRQDPAGAAGRGDTPPKQDNLNAGDLDAGRIVADIVGPDRDGTGYVPWQLRKKKRKKKGRSL